MIDVDVTKDFKRNGQQVRLVIAHSTSDDLGEKTAGQLTSKLKGVNVVAVGRVGTLKELLDLVRNAGDFNVLAVVAHGNESLNAARLFADVDENGKPVRLKAAEFGIFDDVLSDKLCLFGICYYGSENLAIAVCERAGAMACIAPKPDQTITASEVVEGFSELLNAMAAQKGAAFGIDELHSMLLPKLDKRIGTSNEKLLDKLSVYPPA